MKSSIAAAVGLGFAVTLTAAVAVAVGQDTRKAAAPAAPAGDPKDVATTASYGLGLSIGRNLKEQASGLDPDLFIKGFKDGIGGAKSQYTDQQIQDALQAFDQQIRAKRMEAAKSAGAKNKKDGDAFLAANKAKPGVVTLPSGLQYKVVKEGAGKSPRATDTVSVHYRGTLLDGTEFDSSYKRGQPASFPVNGVIPGWTEALQRMKVGSKWQLFIPSELAYGPQGPPGSPIGPNSVLVFDVELLGIK